MERKVYLPKSLEELTKLGKAQHIKFWERYFSTPPPRHDQQMLRTLWFKIQCESRGIHIKQKHVTRLNKYSKNPDKYIEKAFKSKYRLKPGLEIVKTYKGREYRVLVKSRDEFIYNNETYKTISAAAKAICHKKVSGYDFFGLNNKGSLTIKPDERTGGENNSTDHAINRQTVVRGDGENEI